MGMRKVLSVIQFVFSLLFIITSILIYNQFRYFIHFKYEFNSKNIVDIDLQNNDYRIAERAFGADSGGGGVSACAYMPAETRSEGGSLRSLTASRMGTNGFKSVMSLATDEHFLDNMGFKLLAGRGLYPEGPGAERRIVVNEAAVNPLGWHIPAEIIGQPLQVEWSDSRGRDRCGTGFSYADDPGQR